MKVEQKAMRQVLIPETVAEAGLLAWLADRYHGQMVQLHFDTWSESFAPGCETRVMPGLAIIPNGEPAND